MFTIVASTNATAAPSDAIASTVRGDGPRRRAGALTSRSAAGDRSTARRCLTSSWTSLLVASLLDKSGLAASASRAAWRPISTTRGSAFQSISPIPSTWGVITRSACSRAAATVSLLPTVTVRTIVSPRRGISASLPVNARRIGRPRRARPGRCAALELPHAAGHVDRDHRPLASARHRRHRKVVEHPAVDEQPAVWRRHRREHTRDRERSRRPRRPPARCGAAPPRARSGRSSNRRSAAAAARSAGHRTRRRAAGAV